MMPASAHSLERFRLAVGHHLGLQFDESRIDWLNEVFARRLQAANLADETYLQWLETSKLARGERQALAQELTIGETYFFRNIEQYQAFTEVALAAATPGKPLRVLSAGCASGEEPYSLAMICLDRDSLGRSVVLKACDMNPAALSKAKAGRYSSWALRETSTAVRQRWFSEDNRDFVIHPNVRAAVTFEERNLADDNADLWLPQSLDVVFCRNVLMYFTPEHLRQVVLKIERALAPGGYLFLGHAETLRGLSQAFTLCHTHGTFYYQRKDANLPHNNESHAYVDRVQQPSSAPYVAEPESSHWTSTWLDVVNRTSSRIAELSRESTQGSSPARRPTQLDSTLPAVYELLSEEKHHEALQLIAQRNPAQSNDPDALLVHASLLAQCNKTADAETVCHQLLVADALNAGAYFILGLCAEAKNDGTRAVSFFQTAAYLDRTFAMPRLKLGLWARRSGDRVTARQELNQALSLLESEDTGRLLLFAGGFGRKALCDLCRAEIATLGGTA